MKAVIGYGLTGAVLVGGGALIVARAVAPGSEPAVLWAAALAYGIQVLAFTALVAVRRRRLAMLAVWGGGTLLRLGVVLGAGLWLTRAGELAPAPLLLSLAGFLFLLLLLEPVFFRVGLQGTAAAAGQRGGA